MQIPEAVCTKCGGHYHGWALLNARHQSCAQCGGKLVITTEDEIIQGYSPFSAEEVNLKAPKQTPSKKTQS
ncbi:MULTISPECIES: hypothetical protein [Dehalococcoides]|jgi:NAD-dependent SIR2 family protein deacetylase|uniref:Uncharacterized protein n=2 Tax=Dehalococcoides mccartyi TaxID=61435 RepID=A0A142V839_9CHLR|nr:MULTISPECIES: hypothetical protein [Dehalococcoides]AGG05789.1 hypothetical protein dcmb_156 [Dehalococcoides mccartyi DCMB5]AGG07203.1 hypothetical protein btf_93 [Dehalococcoides mccartyi BTF08]AII60354.1 hypothetical protein X794_00625 [Dehalococcoides mccartyi CG5]AMU85928.1 hypothetical protein Dm11a5_0096 [Dehalococcoides mccartyi]AOV98802.1 hypothetical protein DCWBC2_0127 [Dehalococcoides mccartyi]